MKLELKKIKTCKFASEETTCFQAQLWYEDIHLANVSNAGKGGCDDIDPLPGRGGQTFRNIIEMIEAHMKAKPPVVHYGVTLPYSLELWVADQVARDTDLQRFKRRLKKFMTFLSAGRVLSVKRVDPEKDIAWLRLNYPHATVLDTPEKIVDALEKLEPRNVRE